MSTIMEKMEAIHEQVEELMGLIEDSEKLGGL